MKLKTKMVWIITSSVLLTVILLVVMIFVFTSLFVSGYNHAKLQEMSVQLSEQLERAKVRNETQLTQEMQKFKANYEGVDMELLGSDGTLLYSSANRTEPYSLQEMTARFTNQPARMFQGQDVTLAYDIAADGKQYFVVFDVKGEAFQQVQLFIYLNQYSAYPFLFVPLLLIIVLPATIAFVFILFVTRRIGKLNRAMRHVDLQEKPVRLQDNSGDEIGALTRLFNEMSDKLYRQYVHTRQIEQARTKLVGSLSHDLRTPLSIIQGYAETLQRGSAHDSETRLRHSTIILQKSEYMNELLHQLFRLAELDDPSKAFRMERGSIHFLLQSIIAEYVLLLKDRGIEWQAELPEPFVQLEYDRDSLAQVFRNLIDNAILHGGDGKFLGIRLNVGNESVQIEIEDRGKGIPQEELEHVFDRFYRVDKGRQSNGLGIGLSLSNEIVNRHGGRITIRSVPNKSTIFTVSLPLNSSGKTPIAGSYSK
ncbi:sensor histidine kinase [Cohnella silvisoli]|uniref:histidine kinase n=1 Tax=Cohnella silvisoli TaxID=2873699 RepID=A0ABV1L473_9BACL|nr:HAMP domain-containing sensor histidine kinase [Cohnella silvisoli]MCD9026433.1 HAMP domain-containing histidine kinase [Cohnella silvisoli]